MDEVDASDPAAMRMFYNRLFPWKQLFTWLNHEQIPTRLFTHREFAFTLAGDIYLRYNSFANHEEMKREVLRLNPSRFEIGAIYTAKPKDKKTLRPSALQPARRELVFDIDMTDYDEIRTCCSDKSMCKRCWGFIACATEVLDHALRDQFGFQHLLWVYSGRRGIHCWISDTTALDLTDDQRRAIVHYLEVVKGGKEMSKKVNVRFGRAPELHPSIMDAYDILGKDFATLILDDQECFKTKEQWETLLSLVPDEALTSKLRTKWSAKSYTSRQKWTHLTDALPSRASKTGSAAGLGPKGKGSPLEHALQDIVLQYTYPRLDADVSKHRNHLLKSPFVIHPGTNRVCVPVDPARISEFDPSTVPTLGQLIGELNVAAAAAKTDPQSVDGENGSSQDLGDEKKVVDWRQTSLKPYVDMLERHSQGLLRQTREKKRNAAQMSTDF
ncbi:prim-pol domain-containing protein [Phaffia rhodozyma]|uniref:DNA primase n=1 Tax=Phaffia rhodozyma TaxID=264483 RepID=A0A0F7SXH1_PHARH|nr:prim-pol domain-containing protein [Phaffia rhodozyma]